MPRILMILTSHRLDCFKLTMDCLLASDSLTRFDRVMLMLNGVEGPHLAYVNRLMAAHPEVQWDTVAGPRGKKERVANLQNETVRRYPHSLYFKIDEDVFVSRGWVEKLTAAYEAHKHDDNLALITPLIPNNALGFYYLLELFPSLAEEYARRFKAERTTLCNGPVWSDASMARWLIRRFIDMEAANRALEANLQPSNPTTRQPRTNNQERTTKNQERFIRFAYRFSINCLVYDYRHWEQMGGIPNDEEPAWGQWVPDHGKFNVLVTDTLVQHYSFFVQQDWMDRTPLLEDFRRANLSDTLSSRISPAYWGPWLGRCAEQFPRALARKARSLLGG